MHIAEGVLSAPVLIAGAAAAAAGIAVGLKRLDESRLMTAGLVGAAFFIASLIHVPIGVSKRSSAALRTCRRDAGSLCLPGDFYSAFAAGSAL